MITYRKSKKGDTAVNIALLKELLGSAGESPEIFYYEKTDSTNTRAREYARENRDNRKPKLFIAEEQTAGRGRRGRSFFSEGGVGIYMTLLLYPDERGRDAARLTARAAVALTDALYRLTSLKPQIKWVNDVYVGEKKLSGILAEGEMSSDGNLGFVILGMGINVYKTAFPDEISTIATSIENECGERISREELSAEIIKNLLCSPKSEKEILEKYRERNLVLGREITVLPIGKEPYTATAVDVLDDYSLLVKTDSGESISVFSGEVSVKLS